MPECLVPMLARLSQLPTPDDDFAYEIKWDGVRAIAYIENGSVRLQSRNLLNITARYPELHALGRAVRARNAILDGEIVAFTGEGTPSFERLQLRLGLVDASDVRWRMRSNPVTFMIFDLLYHNGVSLMGESYLVRRRLLEALELFGPSWQTPPYNIGQGRELLEFSRAQKLEGIIAKHIDSPYEPGCRTGTWRKIKNQLSQEFVIGGWTSGEGGRTGRIGALLLGCYDRTPDEARKSAQSQKFLYAGKVGTGFTDAMLDKLAAILAPLRQFDNPFAERHPDHRNAVFVAPTLMSECVFSEWTRDGRLRHPSFKGLRLDKPVAEVVRERVAPNE